VAINERGGGWGRPDGPAGKRMPKRQRGKLKKRTRGQFRRCKKKEKVRGCQINNMKKKPNKVGKKVYKGKNQKKKKNQVRR